jgi:hypothetical protein
VQRITVTRFSDGAAYTGTVESSDKTPGPDGAPVDRLVVVRDDNGTKEFVLPGITAHVVHSEAVEQPAVAPGLEHLAPPPGAPTPPPGVQVVGAQSVPAVGPSERLGSAPPAGSSVAGVPIPPVSLTAVREQTLVPLVPPEPEPEPERRFMVQSKSGRTTVYHTVPDCPRASGDQPTLPVDDRAIEFFDLALCTSCAKLADQVSWREVMEQILSNGGADPRLVSKVVYEFEKLGFSVRPNRVERPGQPDAGDKDS